MTDLQREWEGILESHDRYAGHDLYLYKVMETGRDRP
jgi:hypothetical protein